MRRGALSISIVAAIAFAITAAPAHAGNITVTKFADENTNGNGCSLREAILEANANTDAEPDCAYSPAASGTDTITLTAGNYVVADGELFATESLNLINPAGLAMLDGDGDSRILVANGTLTMDRVGVKEGSTTGSGAGIVANGSLSISNATVELNTSSSTGGPTIGGGGIWMAGGGNLFADRVRFSQNSAFSSNLQANGGAILLSSGSGGTIVNSEFAQNSASIIGTTAINSARGGAIAVPGATTNANTLEISGTSFTGNQAGQQMGPSGANSNFGGAIFWSDGNTGTSAELRIDNSTFTGNTAQTSTTNGGGAINLVDGTGKLAQVTFANNATTAAPNEGDAIRYSAAVGTGTFTVRGTVFDDSSDDECRATAVVGLTSAGGNVDQSTTCPFLAGQDKQNQDPNTQPLNANGGPTQTRALPAGSPAIDANGGCSSTNGGFVTNDQRGFTRGSPSSEDGAACDSGAYERVTCKGQNATMTGTDAGAVLFGTSGNDVIAGFGGDDTINGGGGADTLCGGTGNDILAGEAGADTYDGGVGTNTVAFATAPSGVQVDLVSPGTASGGDGSDSGFDNIQSLFGSIHTDTLAGDAGNNALDGGSGDDVLEGRGGDDTLAGGLNVTDNDRVVYDQAGSGVRVNLGTGIQNTIADGVDTLSSIENVTGSPFDDELTGNGNVNAIDGIGGSDTVDYSNLGGDTTVNLVAGTSSGASGANDTLTSIENAITGGGDDTLIGNGEDNDLIGLGGEDTITGGAGPDSLLGFGGADTIFARDGVSDTVDCGTETDSAEVDVAGTDTLTDCENPSFAIPPVEQPVIQTPQTQTPQMQPPATTPKPGCKKGFKVVKGKCRKAKRKKKKK